MCVWNKTKNLKTGTQFMRMLCYHDDVIKWKHFPRYWPVVCGIHRSPVNSPHKGQWCRALMFSLIYVRINGWVNNREAGDLRRYRTDYDVIVMMSEYILLLNPTTNNEALIVPACGLLTFRRNIMIYTWSVYPYQIIKSSSSSNPLIYPSTTT